MHNPATDELIGTINLAGATEVDAAVAAAREAYENGPWPTYSGEQRSKLLNKLADLIDAHVLEIARAESEAMGQPSGMSEGWVVPASAQCFRYYAGE